MHAWTWKVAPWSLLWYHKSLKLRHSYSVIDTDIKHLPNYCVETNQLYSYFCHGMALCILWNYVHVYIPLFHKCTKKCTSAADDWLRNPKHSHMLQGLEVARHPKQWGYKGPSNELICSILVIKKIFVFSAFGVHYLSPGNSSKHSLPIVCFSFKDCLVCQELTY